jgi:deoxycytidine triphosphate deaminase
MLIIDKNLRGLVSQHSICDDTLVEDFCLSIRLGSDVFLPKKAGANGELIDVTYGHSPNPASLFHEKKKIDQNLCLAPREVAIASSDAIYKIPRNYFGLVQTKGTLARMFVSITCSDGQIEPGFNGKITLEIVNLSPWNIRIPVFSEVGQLYLIKCSSEIQKGYHGRYEKESKNGPTIPIWEKN